MLRSKCCNEKLTAENSTVKHQNGTIWGFFCPKCNEFCEVIEVKEEEKNG